jgi:hypothetical protein
VAVAVAVANVALAVPSLWYGLRRSPVAVGECLSIFLRPLVAAGLGAAVVVAAGPHLPDPRPALFSLALRLVVFGVVYAVTWVTLPGGVDALRNIVAGMSELRSVRSRDGTASALPAQSAT